VPVESVEALSDALLAVGALAVDVADAYAGTPRERAQFVEWGQSAMPVWEFVKVSALFREADGIATKVASALSVAGLDSMHGFEISRVEDRDWVRATQGQFEPMRISRRLWVVPTWHLPPDPDAVNLIIDPGLAFGSGTHPTTQLCLAWLDANLRGGEAVLDYGCGSGILAVAAMKLGAACARGVDIDPVALITARHNAVQNQVTILFETAERGVENSFDIVLANILASPLQLLAPLLARATRGGGRIALSGILEQQQVEVINSYREWFNMGDAQHSEGWVLLHGIRHRD